MSAAVAIDGVLRSSEDAVVPVTDRGFLYGDAAFATLRTYGGRPFAVEEHLGRLQRSAHVLGIVFPVSLGTLRAEVDQVVAAAANAESRVRVILTRGDQGEGFAPPSNPKSRRIVMATALDPPSATLYQRGLAVITVAHAPVTFSVAGETLKTTNYLPNVMLHRLAAQAGADDAIACADDDGVLDAATSSVFAWVDGRWLTPALRPGVLDGVTRARLLDLVPEIHVTNVRRHELMTADEVFLASTVRELVSVVRIDEHVVGDGEPGERTRALHRRYRTHVGAPGDMPWA